MPNYDVNSVLQFGRLKEFGASIASQITASIKAVDVDNMQIKFWTNATKTGAAAFTIDLPSELVLDQLATKFEAKFKFDATKYAGATNPSMENKPVLVIAVKDTAANGTVKTNYSFLNMETLVDVYSVAADSAKVLAIDSDTNAISIKISATEGNRLTINNDGLMVNVSDKVDKVASATAGDIALMTADGGISDSGYSFATTADVNELLGELFPTENAGD